MDFDFSDDQKQLQEQVRRFLTYKCPSSALRAVLEGPEPFNRELYRNLGEMGVLGTAIPEEYGGIGLGHALAVGGEARLDAGAQRRLRKTDRLI